MARLVALVACIAAGSASVALGGSESHVTWSVGPTRLLSPTFGYATVGWRRASPNRLTFGGGLYLYRDGRWTKTTMGWGEDVAFPDEQHGWVATYDCARALVSVYRTVDGGAGWQRLPVRTTHSCGGGPTYLSFPNTRDGWLEPVSPNGPGGILLRTINGGATWPVYGAVDEGDSCLNRITAISASVAWMPCGGLVRTVDGGRTWHPQMLPLPAQWWRGAVTSAGDPRFFGRHGVVAVTAWSHGPKAVLFFTSDDAGRTWSYRAARSADGFCQRTFPWPSNPEAITAIAAPQTWWVVSNRFGRIDVTHDAGRHWQSHASATLRRLGWCHVRSLTAGSASFAWATTNERLRSALYETHDGGRTWRPVPFPLR